MPSETNAPLSAGDDQVLGAADLRGGILVCGGTARDRAERVQDLRDRALCDGAGVIHVVGGCGTDALDQLRRAKRRHGRAHGVGALDFRPKPLGRLGGAPAPAKPSWFSTANSDAIIGLVSQVMLRLAVGDERMSLPKSVSALSTITTVLVWMRDSGRLDLDLGAIRRHCDWNVVMDLAGSGRPAGMPHYVHDSLRSYLSSLPGYRGPEHGDDAMVAERHRCFTRPLLYALSALAQSPSLSQAAAGVADLDACARGDGSSVVVEVPGADDHGETSLAAEIGAARLIIDAFLAAAPQDRALTLLLLDGVGPNFLAAMLAGRTETNALPARRVVSIAGMRHLAFGSPETLQHVRTAFSTNVLLGGPEWRDDLRLLTQDVLPPRQKMYGPQAARPTARRTARSALTGMARLLSVSVGGARDAATAAPPLEIGPREILVLRPGGMSRLGPGHRCDTTGRPGDIASGM